MHGQGTYKWNDGRKYTGQYVDGLKEGLGKMELPNGDSFEGQFLKDKQHGIITYR
jgi:hypothetical protein